MKHILTLLAIITIMAITSCKKKTEVPRPSFADIEFFIYDFRAPGDSIISEVNYSSTVVIKGDFTWSIDLGGAKSNGTYTWVPTSNQQGEIKFKILNWTDLSSNQFLSDKLKSALQAVNHCGYSLGNPSFANFLVNNYQGDYFPFLRTNKK